MLNDEMRHLLIIGAYRDNEVNSSHPFLMAIDELQTENAVINTIFLSNLQPIDVNCLLQQSLKCEEEQTQPLTDLIYQKTGGNAFFTHQFLLSLYSDALLHFDFEQHQWQWDIEKIAAQNITTNVVELMANKINQLPSKTSRVLQLAACIGNQFDLSMLVIINEPDQNETLSVLRPALAIPPVYKCKPGLHGNSIFECKRIDAGVDCYLTKGSDVCLINFSHWSLGKKMDKIVLNFFVIVSNLIGHCR